MGVEPGRGGGAAASRPYQGHLFPVWLHRHHDHLPVHLGSRLRALRPDRAGTLGDQLQLSSQVRAVGSHDVVPVARQGVAPQDVRLEALDLMEDGEVCV